jgi:hypothetical protein
MRFDEQRRNIRQSVLKKQRRARQDLHVATVRPFGPKSYGLVRKLLPVFSRAGGSRVVYMLPLLCRPHRKPIRALRLNQLQRHGSIDGFNTYCDENAARGGPPQLMSSELL